MTETDKTRVIAPEGDGTHIQGTFFGKRVDALAEDLYPVKNHLPAELGVMFKTARHSGRISVSAYRTMRSNTRCTHR